MFVRLSSDANYTSCEEQDDNSTYFLNGFKANDVSSWILIIYFANLLLGAILNALSFIAIFKSKRNGTLSIILQLSAADVFSSCVCVIEILSLGSNTWPFPTELCPVFSGLEILTNTLVLYMIIALNFHTISICNMKIYESERGSRNPLTSCDASNECLVRDSRNIVIDYRNRRKDVSIMFPCILIWFACLSLSIPQFTLSSTVKNFRSNRTICAIIDVNYGRLLNNLLILFRVIIPMFLMSFSIIILCLKLFDNFKKNAIQNIFAKKSHNVLYYLIFCLVLNFAFLITSLQRVVLFTIHATTTSDDLFDNYNVINFYSVQCTYRSVTIVLSMLHYSGMYFRFLIYLFLLPKFKSLILNNILMCFKNKN